MERTMASPIEPEMCLTTGRLLTEWFEYPEITEEQAMRMACELYGADPENPPKRTPGKLTEEGELAQKIQNFVTNRVRRRKFPNGMTMLEAQYRLNEATKMVNPDNFKFLPDDVRERTGLEINPLWMMECLVRSGLLTPKEQVVALKELAQYTHSKSPSISHATTTHMKPEDWLLELAKDEYKVLGTDIPIPQPKQPIERGAGAQYEENRARKIKEASALMVHGSEIYKELEEEYAEFEDLNWDDLDSNR